jgi:hypothetical protein
MPVLTRNLLVVVILLGFVYAMIQLFGEGPGSHAMHHHGHHHDHETMVFEPLLGVGPEGVLDITIVHIEAGEMLRVSANGMVHYTGEVTCEGAADVGTLQVLRETTDTGVYQRWQGFFSRMTPDAQIVASTDEDYGLNSPIGCFHFTVQRGEETETLVVRVGDATAQGLNRYMRINGYDEIWLIPRYFWTEAVDVMGI